MVNKWKMYLCCWGGDAVYFTMGICVYTCNFMRKLALGGEFSIILKAFSWRCQEQSGHRLSWLVAPHSRPVVCWRA